MDRLCVKPWVQRASLSPLGLGDPVDDGGAQYLRKASGCGSAACPQSQGKSHAGRGVLQIGSLRLPTHRIQTRKQSEWCARSWLAGFFCGCARSSPVTWYCRRKGAEESAAYRLDTQACFFPFARHLFQVFPKEAGERSRQPADQPVLANGRRVVAKTRVCCLTRAG